MGRSNQKDLLNNIQELENNLNLLESDKNAKIHQLELNIKNEKNQIQLLIDVKEKVSNE